MHELDQQYLTTYIYHIGKHGRNHKERELNYGIRNFEKFLSEHPSCDRVLIDGHETTASIASNKQNPYITVKEILTRLTDVIEIGSFVEWNNNHWLVYQKEQKPNCAYHSCLMVMCNHKIQWIDKYGVEREQYAYIVSSKDSMVKQNFRTWNKLITPQPNQYLEILTATNPDIAQGQRFIVSDRAWFVAEYDKTSAPGVTYYSLTETKIDRFDDNVKDGLADYNTKDRCVIELESQKCELGKNKILSPVVYLDGHVTALELDYEIEDESVATLSLDADSNVVLTPVSKGKTILTVSLSDHPEMLKKVDVEIGQETKEDIALVGDDEIRVTDSAIYYIGSWSTDKTIVPITKVTISDETLATATVLPEGRVRIEANDKNLLGYIDVSFSTATSSYYKRIKIKSLW